MRRTFCSVLSLGGFFAVALLLSGCAAAVMTGAKTVKGSESETVVIVPKKELIQSVSELTVDTSGLVGDDAAKKNDIASNLQGLLIDQMTAKGLYQPDDKTASRVNVTVRTIKRDIQQRGVYAIVDVLNPAGEIIFSFASVERSLGVRTIDHVERAFSESTVALIAAPLDSE